MTSHHIIARADALMHRRRQPNDSEDVPILTDIVDGTEAPPEAEISEAPEPLVSEAPALAISAELQAHLQTILMQRIEQHLAQELPKIIASTLEDILTPQSDDKSSA